MGSSKSTNGNSEDNNGFLYDMVEWGAADRSAFLELLPIKSSAGLAQSLSFSDFSTVRFFPEISDENMTIETAGVKV